MHATGASTQNEKKIRTHRMLLVKLRGSAILNMKRMLPRTLCPNSKPPSSYFFPIVICFSMNRQEYQLSLMGTKTVRSNV